MSLMQGLHVPQPALFCSAQWCSCDTPARSCTPTAGQSFHGPVTNLPHHTTPAWSSISLLTDLNVCTVRLSPFSTPPRLANAPSVALKHSEVPWCIQAP